MAQPEQGIDLTRSGWDNPEGFQPRERERASKAATQIPPVCGHQHPDGWGCEKAPGHKPADQHWADNGDPGGLRWTQRYADVSTLGDDPDRPHLIPAGIETERPSLVEDVVAIATKALESQSPAAWAVALDKILEACHAHH